MVEAPANGRIWLSRRIQTGAPGAPLLDEGFGCPEEKGLVVLRRERIGCPEEKGLVVLKNPNWQGPTPPVGRHRNGAAHA